MSIDQAYEERELFLRIAEGDEHSFATLFHRYSTPLSQLAFRMLHDNAAKQEVMQEMFIKLWLNRDRLKDVEHPAAWLRKVTIHECLQYLRKTSTYNDKLNQLKADHTVTNDALAAISVREIHQAVNRALRIMSPQRRTIYELSRGQGMSSKEIAEQLGLSDGYVRNALSAALQAIRSQLPSSVQLPAIIILLLF